MKRPVDRFSYEYRERPDPVMSMADDSPGPHADGDPFAYDSYEYEGVVGESRRILGRIREAIDEREEETGGNYPRTLVLGVEDYTAVDAWVRYQSDTGESIESAIGLDIVVVPGRMIHVPKRSDAALRDGLADD